MPNMSVIGIAVPPRICMSVKLRRSSTQVYVVMAYIVMAHVVMAYISEACAGLLRNTARCIKKDSDLIEFFFGTSPAGRYRWHRYPSDSPRRELSSGARHMPAAWPCRMFMNRSVHMQRRDRISVKPRRSCTRTGLWSYGLYCDGLYSCGL